MTVLTSIPTSSKSYAIFLFNIYDSSGQRIGHDNYLTHYNLTLPVPYAGSTYSIGTDLLSSGVISYFEVILGDGLTINDQCFIGRSQNTMYRASIPFSPSNFNFSSISNYSGYGSNCHTDIRDVKTIYDVSTDKYVCFVAHDGGVSMTEDLLNTNNDSDWDNINGEGLTITEFVGFGNSELDKERVLASAVDGNSKRRMISTTPPIEPTFYQGPGGDSYDCAVSTMEVDRGVYITNGYGTKDPAYTKGYSFSTNGTQSITYSKADGADENSWLDNYALRPLHFDNQGRLWNGTTDVFMYPDYVGSSSLYEPISYSFEKWTLSPPTERITNNVLTAYKCMENYPSVGITACYYVTKKERHLGTSYADPVKIVYQEYDPSNPFDKYQEWNDITPVFDEDGNPSNGILNQFDLAFASDLEINSDNPNQIWVSFGGNTQGGNGQILEYILKNDAPAKVGKVYFYNKSTNIWTNRSEGLPPYPVLCLEYLKGSDDIIFAGTDVGVYVWNKTEDQWECYDTDDKLPYCSVNELEINYCTMTLRACAYG
ncbi:MAG TPA: hypothetical protein VFM99_01720, partial [Chitinophagales bacterium]|nr:hypothetical protein [Chitinophagales bacterium]